MADTGRAAPNERPALKRLNTEAKRLRQLVRDTPDTDTDPGQWAALAYPDRIGLRRPGSEPRWLLSGGRGAKMDPTDSMASARLIVAPDLDGAGVESRLRKAIEITDADLRASMGEQIMWQDSCHWSKRDKRVKAVSQERLGALTLTERKWDAPADDLARAMLDGVRQLGLPSSAKTDRFRLRVALLRNAGRDLPDMDNDTLMATLDDWLLPHLSGVTTAAAWAQFNLLPALQSMLTWDQSQTLAQEAPATYTTALNRDIPVTYADDGPTIEVRLQEMFGTTRHPMIAGHPAKVILLSPAQRPIQITTDLPGFWTSSYADVRKDMRGRYPKHPWPEDPTKADPTLRAKRRGT